MAKIPQKVYFCKISGKEVYKEQANGEKSKDDTKDPTNFQSSLWPWNSVSKLRLVILELLYLSSNKRTAKQAKFSSTINFDDNLNCILCLFHYKFYQLYI